MLPNFLIIGAQKCGTTALYHYLGQHPQVYMCPLKEPNFFAFEGTAPAYRDANGEPSPINNDSVWLLDQYQQLFTGWSGQAAIGEASPHYLYLSEAAGRIKLHIPDVKLIAVLRHPVDRAYSAFLHAVRANREPACSFAKALQLEEERIQTSCGLVYHYKAMGFYYAQLKHYYALFDPSRIAVYLYDDLVGDMEGTLRGLFRFLEVDASFCPDTSVHYNPSGVPKNLLLHKYTEPNSLRRLGARFLPRSTRALLPKQLILAMARLIRDRNMTKPPLPAEDRAVLSEVYREDILRLSELIDRDLSHWLTGRN